MMGSRAVVQGHRQAGGMLYRARVTGLSQSAAQGACERLKIRGACNVVAPGYVDTAMTEVLGEPVKAKMVERIPTGRIGRPEDIAAAVVYLASAEAGWVTGQTLHVNGGMAMY